MKIKDLEFENGNLVKVNGVRHNYMNGNQMINTIDELGKLVYSLRHQLIEVTGTIGEYDAIPTSSLLNRHLEACRRASKKLEEL